MRCPDKSQTWLGLHNSISFLPSAVIISTSNHLVSFKRQYLVCFISKGRRFCQLVVSTPLTTHPCASLSLGCPNSQQTMTAFTLSSLFAMLIMGLFVATANAQEGLRGQMTRDLGGDKCCDSQCYSCESCYDNKCSPSLPTKIKLMNLTSGGKGKPSRDATPLF